MGLSETMRQRAGTGINQTCGIRSPLAMCERQLGLIKEKLFWLHAAARVGATIPPPPPNENIVFCCNCQLTSNLPGASCSPACSGPPPSSCSGLGLLCLRCLEVRSLDKAGLNEDICFHSGSAGTRPSLLSETISRHLLAADCSGRFLPLPSPSTRHLA